MSQQLELSEIEARLDHPEGVAWGPDGRVYAGGQSGQVYRIDLADGSCDSFADTGGFVLGLALDGDANVYTCDLGRRAVVRVTPDGSSKTYSSGTPERGMKLPNYPVFDGEGNLYVSDSGDWGQRDGCIWRIAPGGETEIWTEAACGFTNGMCLTADGNALYVVESSPPLLARIEVAADGSAGEREVLMELPRTVPDGVALDRDDNLYLSYYNPNLIQRMDPDGELTTLYDDWEQLTLKSPTNTAFAGPDLQTLVIANVSWLHLVRAPVEVPGLPLRYPKLG